MKRYNILLTSILFTLCTLLACATPKNTTPAAKKSLPDTPSPFPSQNELSKLASQPKPTAQNIERASVDVQTWTLQTTPSNTFTHRPFVPSNTLGALLQTQNQKTPQLQPTEGLHCAATEFARFYDTHQAFPPAGLHRFILSHCGVATSNVFATSSRYDNVDPKTTDTELLQSARKTFQPALEQLAINTPSDQIRNLSISLHRSENSATFVLTHYTPNILLTQAPKTPDGRNTITVQGRVLDNFNAVRGLSNQGRFNTQSCLPDLTVQLPNFSLTCTLDPSDSSAWVEFSGFRPNRILGNTLFTLLTFPSKQPTPTYIRFLYSTPTPPPQTSQRTAILNAINSVRANAKLPPLALADAQSNTADQLAPHYFASVYGDRPQTDADQIALGMRAGWQVNGNVQHGLFAASYTSQPNNPSSLISNAVERPYERAILFNPRTQHIAIGLTSLPHNNALGALFATYQTLNPNEDHITPNRVLVLKRLTQQRTSLSRSAPSTLMSIQSRADDIAKALQKGSITPQQALDQHLSLTANHMRGPVQGWIITTDSLDNLPFPPQLLNAPKASVSITAAPYRAPNSPWSSFVVLIAVHTPQTL